MHGKECAVNVASQRYWIMEDEGIRHDFAAPRGDENFYEKYVAK